MSELFVYTILAGIFIVALWWSMGNLKRRLQEMRHQLFPDTFTELKVRRLHGLPLDYHIIIQLDGRRFALTDSTGSKRETRHTRLEVTQDSPVPFTILREDYFTRFKKKLGVEKEMEIGRRDLDDRLLLRMENNVQCRNLLINDEFQKALEMMVELGTIEQLSTGIFPYPEKSGPTGSVQLRFRDIVTTRSKDECERGISILKLVCLALEKSK